MATSRVFLHLDTGDRFEVDTDRAVANESHETAITLADNWRGRTLAWPEIGGTDLVIPANRVAFLRILPLDTDAQTL